MKAKRKLRKVRTVRIYYGPAGDTEHYFTVRVEDAKTPVTIKGKAIHALRGWAGMSIDCALSNAADDNKSAFPHPVLLPYVTGSRLYVVCENRRGKPYKAIRYSHRYGWLVEKNDDCTLKEIVANDPSFMERDLTFSPPQKMKGTGPHTSPGEKNPYKPRAFSHRGSLKRAVKAGIISRAFANQLERNFSEEAA